MLLTLSEGEERFGSTDIERGEVRERGCAERGHRGGEGGGAGLGGGGVGELGY